MQSLICLSLIGLLFVLNNNVDAVHDSMNFHLQPLHRECFFEDFDSNSPVRTIDAFVQAGGNADVLLTIHGPLELDTIRNDKFEDPIAKELINVAKETESETLSFTMDFKPKSSGTYGICLDNRNSRFVGKNVQLDVRQAARPEPVALDETHDRKNQKNMDAAKDEEGKELERAKESIGRIRKGLIKIQMQQQRDRHRLSLHTQTNTNSHIHVVTGSIVETVFFIAAAIFQIFFVRRWFAGRSLPPSAPRSKEWA